jgi:transketolase
VFSLSRQGLPQLEGSSAEKVAFGAYVLQDGDAPVVILVGTGSEVSLCVTAKDELKKANIEVSCIRF